MEKKKNKTKETTTCAYKLHASSHKRRCEKAWQLRLFIVVGLFFFLSFGFFFLEKKTTTKHTVHCFVISLPWISPLLPFPFFVCFVLTEFSSKEPASVCVSVPKAQSYWKRSRKQGHHFVFFFLFVGGLLSRRAWSFWRCLECHTNTLNMHSQLLTKTRIYIEKKHNKL